MRLLVTRPEGDAARTAAALRERGHEVLLAALLRVEPIAFELGQQAYRAVIMTSANGARAMAQHPARARFMGLPAFVVGRHSAAAARAAGFREVHSAEGTRSDLIAMLRTRLGGSDKPVLHLAGEDRSGDLANCGARVETVVAYRAVKVEHFPPAVVLSALDGVLHFSARSAEAYLECAGRDGMVEQALKLSHFCLSRQVAEPLIGAGAADVRVAPRPNEAALIDLIPPP